MNKREITSFIKLLKSLGLSDAEIFKVIENKNNTQKEHIYSGKTTKEERKRIREFVESPVVKPSKPKLKIADNPFKVGNLVELKVTLSDNYIGGKIIYIACKEALPSVRLCNKKSCKHDTKNYVWVKWKNEKVISYLHTKLNILPDDYAKPKIGKELSGKIGPWNFDHTTKKWKKDGDEKEYSEQEFSDILYYEWHPEAKQHCEDIMRAIKNIRP